MANYDVYSKEPLIRPTGESHRAFPRWSPAAIELHQVVRAVLGGLVFANGVMYFEASGLFRTLHALDLKTGAMLHSTVLSGGISGPSAHAAGSISEREPSLPVVFRRAESRPD